MDDRKKHYLRLEDAARVLQDMGYRGKVGDAKHPTFIESAALGWNFRAFFFERSDEEGEGFAAYQFETGMYLKRSSNLPRLLEVCNHFNNEFRFAKFAIGGRQQKFVSLQMDFNVVEDAEADFAYKAGFFIYTLNAFIDNVVNSVPFQGDDFGERHSAALSYLWGTERNPEEALRLYREAAQGGYAGSQNNLGDQYETGENVAKSELYAAYWYARSAERGEPTAYLSLATLFESAGADTEMLVDAAKFALLAIDGLPDGLNKEAAQNCLSTLTEKLGEEELARAHELAEAWRPLFQETRLMSDTPDTFPDGPRLSSSLH